MKRSISPPDTSTRARVLTYTRTFGAPGELVWKAWTVPGFLGRWWGPKVFTAPIIRIDLREGGVYLWCMRSPEGRDFCNTGEYLEIVPMERIVFTQRFADAEGNVVPAEDFGLPGDWPSEIVVSVTFESLRGKTKITVKETGIPDEMSGPASAGMNESLDKLAVFLDTYAVTDKSEPSAVDEFVKSRVLPEFQPVVAMLRDLMRETAPEVKEVISYGIPAYKGRKLLAVINPTKNYITFGFSRGAEFEDHYGLLRGEGHVSKHVRIRNLEEANKDALRYYIQQALKFDAESE